MERLDAASGDGSRLAPSCEPRVEPRGGGVGIGELRSARRAVGLLLTTARLVVEGGVELEAPEMARRAQRTARTLLAVHGVEVRHSGPAPRPPAILVTNHVSYLDPLVIAAVAPCIAIAKGEVRHWPLFGAGLRALGVVFVRRGDVHSGAIALRRTWRALDRGAMVLNFPEGTTSDGRSIAPFRRGIFGLAGLARVEVVPAHVSYDDDRVPWFGGQTLAPHYWKLSRATGVRARVRFGEPITVRASDDPQAVAAGARAIVAGLASSHSD
jgi:1-acyl-sn-glycerol-3-phosphate acyltransferase